jgi:hypothetical protein
MGPVCRCGEHARYVYTIGASKLACMQTPRQTASHSWKEYSLQCQSDMTFVSAAGGDKTSSQAFVHPFDVETRLCWFFCHSAREGGWMCGSHYCRN